MLCLSNSSSKEIPPKSFMIKKARDAEARDPNGLRLCYSLAYAVRAHCQSSGQTARSGSRYGTERPIPYTATVPLLLAGKNHNKLTKELNLGIESCSLFGSISIYSMPCLRLLLQLQAGLQDSARSTCS